MPAKQQKIKQVLGEFRAGKLRSGSKSGPKVTSRKQALAIALNSANRVGRKSPRRGRSDGR